MNARELISIFQERGFEFLNPEPGKLRVSGGRALTDQEREVISSHKEELLKAITEPTEPAGSIPSHSYRLEALNGLPLLSGDRKFIRQRLRLLPGISHEKVLKAYHNRFINGMETEPAGHKKDNAGRYQANTWLLEISTRPSER